MKLLLIIFLIFINYSFFEICIEGDSFCLKCDKEKDLCIQCINNEIFTPDNQGGCIGINKCTLGENFCMECNTENNLCESCDIGFFPDNIGGCSYIDNCEISFKGLCLKCKDDFLLIGNEEEFKFCKSIYSSDLKNCKVINEKKGVCTSCEEGYFLGQGDSTCVQTENCYESTFGKCDKCIDGYYLNKKMIHVY